MRAARWFQLLFAVYCAEAGVLLLLLPWTAAWERLALTIPFPADVARGALLSPWIRGLASGFGGLHLVWAAHDLLDWIARRSEAS